MMGGGKGRGEGSGDTCEEEDCGVIKQANVMLDQWPA